MRLVGPNKRGRVPAVPHIGGTGCIQQGGQYCLVVIIKRE